MNFILHSYRRCPFCIRTRILFYLKGIDYEIVEEPLRKWTKWMRDWSSETGERPRVPVLVYINSEGIEKVMPESHEMNKFVDSINGKPEYTPLVDTEAYRDMETWQQWCDNELKPLIDLYKYGKDLRFDTFLHGQHTQALREKLFTLEEALSQKGEYLIEDRLTLADIAIIPFIRQIMRTRDGEFDFTDFSRIVVWTNSILQKEWFDAVVMKKYPLAEVEESFE